MTAAEEYGLFLLDPRRETVKGIGMFLAEVDDALTVGVCSEKKARAGGIFTTCSPRNS